MRIEAARAIPPGDRSALIELWLAAWAAAMPEIDFSARRPWFEDHLASLVDGGALLLIGRDDAGQPVGFATVEPGTGVLDQLAVAPAHQGRGAATALLLEAKRLSPGGLTLQVNKANARALRFYERQGFSIIGESTNPRSGLPIWTMRWDQASRTIAATSRP